MKTILYVCTGNTCRSPIAEYLTKKYAKHLGKEVSVLSAGLEADGSPINKNSLEVLKLEGVDASNHISTQLDQDLISTFDIVVTMTKKHLDSIVDDFDVTGVALMTLAKVGGSSGDVEDPYEQDLQKYKDTKNEIDLYVSMFLSIILIPGR